MKKLIYYLIFSFLIFSSAHSREYCDEGLKLIDPIGDKSALMIALLETELECLGKLENAKKFKKLVSDNLNRTIAESMPRFPGGSKWRECGAKHLDNDINNLSDPSKKKKYHECESKRIEELYNEHFNYSLNLFYSFAN
tara:strand:+ start:562 stop:978 length:417 start_codon:yes stop_codon:yes gene_type:complete